MSALNSSNQYHLLPETYMERLKVAGHKKRTAHRLHCFGPQALSAYLVQAKCKSLNQKELPARKKMPWEQTVDSIQ